MAEIPKGHIAADAGARRVITEAERGSSVTPELQEACRSYGQILNNYGLQGPLATSPQAPTNQADEICGELSSPNTPDARGNGKLPSLLL